MAEDTNVGLTIEHTERGFEIARFEDRTGLPCTLQQSSLAIYDLPGSSAIWLGIDDEWMHLTIDMVSVLVAHLLKWIESGSFILNAEEKSDLAGALEKIAAETEDDDDDDSDV